MKRIAISLFLVCALAPVALAQDAFQTKIAALSASLGTATGEVQTTVNDGRVQEFENGTVYSSPNTGVYMVSGVVLTKYTALGAEGGALGYPVGELHTTATGTSQLFEHGIVTVSRTTGDPTAEILAGVSIAEGSLTVTDPGILGTGNNDGMLTIRQGDANFVSINCSCIEDPDPNPPTSSDRLGTCSLRYSKLRDKAFCINTGNCKGTCRFTN